VQELSTRESVYLNYLKTLMILGVVLAHCGALWAYKPYTSVFTLLPTVFFFVSGAVTFYSFERSAELGSFYKKRLVGLLVPYALLCLIVLAYYMAVNLSLPPFSMTSLLKWVQINPGNASPFSVQHVWFLQTLLLITIIAPLFFVLLRKKVVLLYLLMALMVIVATMQHYVDLGEMMTLGRLHMEKVLTLSIYYVFGALYYTRLQHVGMKLLVPGLLISLAVAAGTLVGLKLDPDLVKHAYSPDLYFLSSGFVAVFLTLIARDFIMKCVEMWEPFRRYVLFASRHVFGIYILHVLPIFAFSYLFEVEGGRVTVMQGLLRFVVAFVATSILTIPFSRISAKIITRIVR